MNKNFKRPTKEITFTFDKKKFTITLRDGLAKSIQAEATRTQVEPAIIISEAIKSYLKIK